MLAKSPNVIIFGGVGAGKSSVVNNLGGAELAEVSRGAHGCTLKSTPYAVEIKGTTYNIYDTAGLNDGTGNGSQALSNLYDLATSLQNAGGIHLLIFVMRCGAITQNASQNYRLFYDTFCERAVPIVVVLTQCEDNEPTSKSAWKQELRRRLKNHISTQYQKSPRFLRITRIDPHALSSKFRKKAMDAPRRQSSLLIQLRTGHVPLNDYLHRFKKTESPLCLACKTANETPAHFLLYCQAYNQQRIPLRRELKGAATSISQLLSNDKAWK